MPQTQRVPVIGEDVTALMGVVSEPGTGNREPAVGDDVTALMAETPDFRTDNAVGPDGRNVIAADGDRPITDSAKAFIGEATQGLNPLNIAESVQQSFWHPLETLSGALSAQDSLRLKGQDAFRRGDYVTGLRHFIEYALPFGAAAAGGALGGPAGFAGGLAGGLYGSQRLSQAGDYMQEGETAKGLGATVDAATMGILSSPRGARPSARPTPDRAAGHQEMVQFGRERGIPLDAGTTLDSQLAKNIQKKAGGTYGGANIVETAQGKQAAALNRVGRELADDANAVNGMPGRAVDAIGAGEGVQSALRQQIQNHHATATAAYEKLRAIEATPRRPSRGQGMAALDVSQRTPLAVDVTAAVEQLQPLYRQLLRESELGIPMQGAKGRTLAALDGLMNAPNWAPLSVVDAALSDLKAMARGADMPELRTSGQATAAQAVRALDAQVRATAAQAGPSVLKALQEGRAATTAKYATAEAMDLIVRAEPRATFNALTGSRDMGLNKLRVLLREAPKEIPNVARGLLEDILERPTAEGGFKFADKAAADWAKLGAQTKAILFPKPGQVKALDNFFRLAKKIGENPNPSGTANVSRAWALVDALPGYAFAKVLHSPKGVQALTAAFELKAATGRRVGTAIRSGRALSADAAVTAQLAQAAKEAGVVLPFPKAAEQREPGGKP